MKLQTTPLQAKLYCPRPKQDILRRERLFQQLDEALHVPLALVSAPAGYGKSVLAASWAIDRSVPVAWLVLDESESNLAQFLAYLIAALRTVHPERFGATAAVLSTPELPSVEHIAQLLGNDIQNLEAEVHLILDDFHLVDHASPVHELLQNLLNHPPENLHLILLTRRDPPFALSRLRANAQLVDLRMSDLQFRREETEELLNAALGREVERTALANIQTVLEGWGAGIRMVMLAAQRAHSDDDFLRSLSGDVQQIQEYLFDEVIQGLDQSTLLHLACAALPTRFCADLLDAMTVAADCYNADSGAKAFLLAADQSNMFTVALDAAGEWYRFHNLFRELLLQRLCHGLDQGLLERLSTGASAWLEGRGHIGAAIQILLERGASEAATQVVDRHVTPALDADQWLSLEGWLQMFTPAEKRNRPVLLLAMASVAAFNQDIDLIADLVRQLETHQAAGSLTDNQQGQLNFFRALPLFWTGDIAAARSALVLADEHRLGFSQIAGEHQLYLAASTAMSGELELAVSRLNEAEVSNSGRRNIFASRLCAANSYVHYFALMPAKSLCAADRLVGLTESDLESQHAAGWGHYMRALNLLQTGRFEMAGDAAAKGLSCADFLEKRAVVDLHLIRGIASHLTGDEDQLDAAVEALRVIGDAARVGSGLKELASSAVARLHLLGGDIAAATAISAELPRSLSAGTEVFWLEEPAVTWACIQLSSGSLHAIKLACSILTESYRLAEEQHLLCVQVKLLVWRAFAASQLNDPAETEHLLGRALSLAAPAGWMGPFVEAAQWLSRVVIGSHSSESVEAFWHHALAVGVPGEASPPAETPEGTGIKGESLSAQFTNRELDILGLLAERYRNKEIARALFISTNTVNYHLKNIYQKLEVSGRRNAVSRAEQLGIPLKARGVTP